MELMFKRKSKDDNLLGLEAKLVEAIKEINSIDLPLHKVTFFIFQGTSQTNILRRRSRFIAISKYIYK